MQSETYGYRPLLHDDALRLLILHPHSDPRAELSGSLFHTTIVDCDRDLIESYTALSYVWGDACRTGSVRLEDKHVNITANLEAALRNIRDTTRPHRIWADSICINQNDDSERNRQVEMMGRIYSTASKTIIYLGELTFASERIIAAALLRPTQARSRKYSVDGPSEQGVSEDQENNETISDLAQKDLLTRPWFTRVWVFQELVLSNDPWVQCGHMRVRWTSLCSMLLSNALRIDETERRGKAQLQILEDMENARHEDSTDLAHCLQTRRGLGATNWRDFVYAQLGIACDAKSFQARFPINYGKHWVVVFAEAAAMIFKVRGYRYLCAQHSSDEAVHLLPNEQPDLALPSWVPDWRLKYPYKISIFESWKTAGYQDMKGHEKRAIRAYEPAIAHFDVDSLCGVIHLSSAFILGCFSSKKDVIREISTVIPASLPNNCTEWDKLSEFETGVGTTTPGSFGGTRDATLLCEFFQTWLNALQRMHQNWGNHSDSSVQSLMDWFTGWTRRMQTDKYTKIPWEYRSWDPVYHNEPLFYFLKQYMDPEVKESVPEGRRFAVTVDGSIGFVPAEARVGDVVIWGNDWTRLPVVLVRMIEKYQGHDLGSEDWQALGERLLSRKTPIHHCVAIGECVLTQSSGNTDYGKNDAEEFFMIH